MRPPTDQQIDRAIARVRAAGLPICRVDVLDKGISIYTILPDQTGVAGSGEGSAYENWKRQDNDRAAPDQKAA